MALELKERFQDLDRQRRQVEAELREFNRPRFVDRRNNGPPLPIDRSRDLRKYLNHRIVYDKEGRGDDREGEFHVRNRKSNSQTNSTEEMTGTRKRMSTQDDASKRARKEFEETSNDKKDKKEVQTDVNEDKDNDNKDSNNDDNKDTISSKHDKKDENVKSENVGLRAVATKRDRRMFGALMGHLGAARKEFKQNSAVLETREKVEQEAKRKNVEKALELKQLERISNIEAKANTLSKRDQILTEIRKTEIMLAFSEWEQIQKNTHENYITTKSEPMIMWLPKNFKISETNESTKLEETEDNEDKVANTDSKLRDIMKECQIKLYDRIKREREICELKCEELDRLRKEREEVKKQKSLAVKDNDEDDEGGDNKKEEDDKDSVKDNDDNKDDVKDEDDDKGDVEEEDDDDDDDDDDMK